MELIIKNARIVDSEKDFSGEVYIKDGVICEVSEKIEKDCKTVDAQGKVVMPAFVDLHCHFRDPGLTHKEDIETGSNAAVRGGFTFANLMANTKPVCSTVEIAKQVEDKAKKIGKIDVNQILTITKDMQGECVEHLRTLDKSIKFVSDDGVGVNSAKVMKEAMDISKETGLVIISHAEDNTFSAMDMRAAEDVMTYRDVQLAKLTQGHLHMAHVSTKDSLDFIIEGKKSGANITCEVTPHHIALDTTMSTYRVNPPIREKEDVNSVIDAIKGGWVDMIATDHAPHTPEDKKNGAPGISGLETAFAVSYTELVDKGHITLSKLSELMSKNPSELAGINKGQIKDGYEADLVIVDIEKENTIESKNFASKGKNTPFEGMKFKGEVLKTFKAGTVVYDFERGLK